MAVTGSKEAISWVLTLFIVGLLGGALVYVLYEFNASVEDTDVSSFIGAIYDIFDLIPTWVKILVIVGFAGAIALVGMMIYKVYEDKSGKI